MTWVRAHILTINCPGGHTVVPGLGGSTGERGTWKRGPRTRHTFGSRSGCQGDGDGLGS